MTKLTFSKWLLGIGLLGGVILLAWAGHGSFSKNCGLCWLNRQADTCKKKVGPPAKNKRANCRLFIYAGAGISPALDKLGRLFEEQHGIAVDYSYKGSGCLLADITFSRRGDLYIPGELFYLDQAKDRGFISESRIIAGFETVLITQKTNPRKINGLFDLAQPGLKIGLGDAKAVAIGHTADQILKKAGILAEVEKNVIMRSLTVNELGNAVKIKALDAAIVWNATAQLFQEAVDTIEIEQPYRAQTPIPAGILKFSRNPELAREFLDFLCSEQGRRTFQKHGFSIVR